MNASVENIFQYMRYLVTPEDSEARINKRNYMGRDVQGVFKGFFWIGVAVALALAIAGLN